MNPKARIFLRLPTLLCVALFAPGCMGNGSVELSQQPPDDDSASPLSDSATHPISMDAAIGMHVDASSASSGDAAIRADGTTSESDAASSESDAASAVDAALQRHNDATTTTSGGVRSFGYIGCSMTANTFSGLAMQGADRFWPSYGTGGGVIAGWSDASSDYWSKFDAMVSQHGKPSDVLVQICTFKSAGSATVAQLTSAVGVLQQKVPGVKVWIGWQPDYVAGHQCTILGDTVAGIARVRDVAMQGVAAGLGTLDLASPLGPLDGSTTRDSCHANDAGASLLGQQMIDAYGR